MATDKVPKSGEERLERVVKWFRAHQRAVTIGGAALVVVAGAVWFTITAQQRREAFATRELAQARNAVDAGNLPLAANDLSQIMSTYGGTAAAEEGALLLAQIRLQQGQTDLAVAGLRDLLASGPRARFRTPARALLGTALEQAGNLAQAADAYREAAENAEYELLGLQLLMEAGRAYQMAGDTATAAEIYQSIIDEHPDAPGLAEVHLRLGEIRRSDIPS